MGCSCTRDVQNVHSNNIYSFNHPNKPSSSFKITIHLPEINMVMPLYIENPQDKEFMLLSDLVNLACFCSVDSSQIDANFISVYNPTDDEYDYYIERLCGYRIENIDDPKTGKLWNIFINNKKEDWTFLNRNNRIINKSDIIEFKYL